MAMFRYPSQGFSLPNAFTVRKVYACPPNDLERERLGAGFAGAETCPRTLILPNRKPYSGEVSLIYDTPHPRWKVALTPVSSDSFGPEKRDISKLGARSFWVRLLVRGVLRDRDFSVIDKDHYPPTFFPTLTSPRVRQLHPGRLFSNLILQFQPLKDVGNHFEPDTDRYLTHSGLMAQYQQVNPEGLVSFPKVVATRRRPFNRFL